MCPQMSEAVQMIWCTGHKTVSDVSSKCIWSNHNTIYINMYTRCVSLWTYIHYQRATSFQYNPTASHLRLLPEHSRLHSYVSLSKKTMFCLLLLELKI